MVVILLSPVAPSCAINCPVSAIRSSQTLSTAPGAAQPEATSPLRWKVVKAVYGLDPVGHGLEQIGLEQIVFKSAGHHLWMRTNPSLSLQENTDMVLSLAFFYLLFWKY